MSAVDPGVVFSFPTSAFPPLAVGFFGLGTGYLIYGLQELVGFPRRGELVNHATGIWGIWMPGFMQFLAGTYLFLGLTLFHSFSAPPLYMAALAFTAYGVHWFALGGIRRRGLDARANVGMCVAFLLISILGIIVFFHAADHPVGGVFIGLTCVYAAEFFASLGPSAPRLSKPGERALGIAHLGTGLFLMYLTYAVVLNFTSGYSLPV
jgi:hypothetical protein